MDIHQMDWLPGSFSRSPAWRMLRAAHRDRENIQPDPRIDDEWVEVALGLIRSSSAPDLSDPLGAASGLWIEDQERCWLLEARLLTTQPFDEIAAACSLSTAVVEAYHELFFHVRPRLDARDWVITMAVRSYPLNDFDGPQPAGIWKYAAFTGGPRVLEAVVAVTLNQPFPLWLTEGFTDPPREEVYLRLKFKLALAILMAKSTSPLGSLVELHQQLRDLDKESGRPVRDDPMLPVIGEVLSMLERPRRSVSSLRGRPPRKNAPVSLPAQPERISVPSTQGGNREE